MPRKKSKTKSAMQQTWRIYGPRDPGPPVSLAPLPLTKKPPLLRRFFSVRWWCGHLFLFGGPIILLLWIMVLRTFLLPTFGPINAAEAPRDQLFPWLVFRDMSRQQPEVLDALIDRINIEYGRPSEKPLTFVFSDFEKSLFSPPENKTKRQEFRMTKNIDLLMKRWYMRQLEQYDAAIGKEKSRIILECIEDFRWWEAVYVNYLSALDKPIPTRLEFAREFEEMIERFCEPETETTRKRIVYFKMMIFAGFASREVSNAARGFPMSTLLHIVQPDTQ